MDKSDRIASFIDSFIGDDEGLLNDIYKEALDDKVPVIRRASRELLAAELLIKNPANILEIGTAVGYSALFMASCLKNALITTMELDEKRIEIAEKNISRMNMNDRIKVLAGDAGELLKTLDDSCYDFIFVDAAKGQYINYYEDIIRVTSENAVIISDNILQEGEILESHYTVEKRNRTIHDRMREYLYKITHDERVRTSILPVGDGMAVTVKL